MNTVTLYAWDDAPHSLRETAKTLVPAGYAPKWISHTASRQPPSYLLPMLTKAWIESFTNEYCKVFLHEFPDGSEVRVGCERKR